MYLFEYLRVCMCTLCQVPVPEEAVILPESGICPDVDAENGTQVPCKSSECS